MIEYRNFVHNDLKFIIDTEKLYLGGNATGLDPDSYDTELWNWLIDEFKPSVIYDVGCGEGHLLNYFHEKGITAYGSEGLYANIANAPLKVKDNIEQWDYTEDMPIPLNVDMTLSCEFVEHVEEQYIRNYLPQFLSCKILVFTHALPGQLGHHHVNCQDDAYWIDLLDKNNFSFLQDKTDHARSIAHGYWGTVLIFKNNKP